ncbi:aminoglycoside phosphotransferase (APT) family kinase protein [Crossiella equi]|uniref:Aminoglycoside phosphotransferase (APT) family kinase protein n=1 Tax=Crossiella equi TaxID=130796 RepID=A0ABS5ARP0_9PSEU|nr:aminoglycoside phosphotransferase family protein [Crossiella equi]MBP2479225.1 aminoglycoside phosphotransferase (APT) family kinase protein [Crossiella equi]
MTVETTPAITTALARRLVDTQFPHWSGLPLTRLDPAGSDHVIHRLGEDLSVRLPRHSGAIRQAHKEAEWLPRLAPRLPLAVPVLVAVGEPGLGYPWPWAVSRWLDGEVATTETLSGSHEAAEALAGFLTALHGFDAAAPEDLTRAPLAARDAATRSAITAAGDEFDTAAMTELWEAALAAPGRDRPPVWCHGDFHTGNLLTRGGRLSAVIDFGELGVGDPACDLLIAYTLLSADTRATFRAALAVDEATWTRGRGWALATGLNAHVAHAAANPRVAAQTTRQITQALLG